MPCVLIPREQRERAASDALAIGDKAAASRVLPGAAANRPRRSSASGRRVGPLLLRSGTELGSRLRLLHNRSCKARGVPVSCRRGSAQPCRSTQAGAGPRVAGPSVAPTQALRALYGHPHRPANSREGLLTRAARYPAQLGRRSTGCVRRCAGRGDGLPSGIQILPAAADSPGPRGPASAGLRNARHALLIERHLSCDLLVRDTFDLAQIVNDQAGLDGVALKLLVLADGGDLLRRAV
jgi:hypothetical protein